jgi:hypothetical protein
MEPESALGMHRVMGKTARHSFFRAYRNLSSLFHYFENWQQNSSYRGDHAKEYPFAVGTSRF